MHGVGLGALWWSKSDGTRGIWVIVDSGVGGWPSDLLSSNCSCICMVFGIGLHLEVLDTLMYIRTLPGLPLHQIFFIRLRTNIAQRFI